MYLVLGSTGYLGSYFVNHLIKKNEAVRGLSRREIDYTDRDQLISFLRTHKPKFLINAAGYTGKPNVDACELNKADTVEGNVIFPAMALSPSNVIWPLMILTLPTELINGAPLAACPR